MQQVGEQIKDKTINQWSIQFYQEVEKLLSYSNIERFTAIQEQIQQIFGEKGNFFSDSLLSMIIDSRTNEMMELKQEIRILYDQQRSSWEKYLEPSGRGVIEYIQEIV
ncbi:MAG: hypothetical protein C5B45_01755 [Chlamydiae bacterium]|nr:MAG: hypothetical protein C5B45_01755 [Chlamydiota bacterium]